MIAAEAARTFTFTGLSPAASNGDSAVSHQSLEDRLELRAATMLAAFEQVLSVAAPGARAAYAAHESWADRVRAGLLALLKFCDDEPALARYCIVHSAQGDEAVLDARAEVLAALARLLDDERAPARGYPPPLTAQAVVRGVLGVLQEQLAKPNPGSLVELTAALMGFIVLPFLGARAARRELVRPGEVIASPAVAVDPLLDPHTRVNHRREIEVLTVIAGEPGLNNKAVALHAGVSDEGYASRLLARLQRRGLIESARDPSRPGAPNAWRLTVAGERLQATVRAEVAAAPSNGLPDLPEEFAGRLDRRAVSVLRVIGDQPWLSNTEVALRAGVKSSGQLSSLLAHLAGLGLVSARRDPDRANVNAWRLTESGVELDGAIGRESAAPPRSLALDLMSDTGGRLSPRAVCALTVIGAEPGLSNREVARLLGVQGGIRVSQLLARLARRGLIENLRSGGRQNVWRLTRTGERLEGGDPQRDASPAFAHRGCRFASGPRRALESPRRVAPTSCRRRARAKQRRAGRAARDQGQEPHLSPARAYGSLRPDRERRGSLGAV